MMFGSRSEGSSFPVVTFTVHEPPAPEADRIDRADELEFVKDGFSWMTALCPPLGLIKHGLWLAALAYVVAGGGFVLALYKLGMNEQLISILVLAANFYLGLEISTLKRWSLDSAGWRMLGSVTGRNLADCERRFFESWLPGEPIIKATGSAAASTHRGSGGWPFGVKA